MLIRPLERTDLPSLQALSNVAPRMGLADGPVDWEGRLASPSGDTVHRMGLWEGELLRGFYELTPSPRARTRHCGSLLMAGSPCAPLVGHAVDLAHRWLGLRRLDIAVEGEAPELIAALEEHHFQRETRMEGFRHRAGGPVDLRTFGCIKPGWQPEPPSPPPPWPEKGPPAEVSLRPTTPEDALAMARIMRDERVAWGTLQVPSCSGDLWRKRLERPSGVVLVATVQGEVVGNAGLHPFPAPSAHIAMLGISIAVDWQGRGVAARLMEALLGQADRCGLERVQLEVYADNERAIRLYRRFGFVEEGRKRLDVWRAGGFASSRVMSRPRGGFQG